MNNIEVERGVERPPRANSKYPWSTMEVNDSFALPPTTKRKSFAAQAAAAGKRLGRKFSVIQTKEGLRCWRKK